MDEHVKAYHAHNAKLIESCHWLAYKMGNTWARNRQLLHETDDLISEALMGLLETPKTFDPARGNKFSTHAYWMIAKRLQRYCHAANLRGLRGGFGGRFKDAKMLGKDVRFAETDTGPASERSSPTLSIQSLPAKSSDKPPPCLADAIARHLPSMRMRQVFEMRYVQGMRDKDIAIAIGRSRQWVSRIVYHGLCRLRRVEGIRGELTGEAA